MIRISRLTDYGIILLAEIARDPDWRKHNVRDLAAATGLPVPTVSKILKGLVRHGLLVSHRGVKGGYSLARRPEDVSVVEIIHALDGPIAITDCNADVPDKCVIAPQCRVRANWQRINLAVREALDNITLAEMVEPAPAFVPASHLRRAVRAEAIEA